jgi:hypothetical protein
VGNDNLETEGWYYSINNTAFNFTTDSVLTRSFTSDETVTVTVQGTGGYDFTSSIDLVIPPGYKYLGFYGTAGSTHGWLNEIDLTFTDGSKIDKYNQIYSDKIKLVAPLRPDLAAGEGDNINGIFDGQISNTSWDSLIFEALELGILLYMQSDTNRDVQSGVYYTRTNNFDYQIDDGKIFGTNIDPNTFTDAQDESNWNHICDLTKRNDPVGYPYYSYATVIGIGNANTTIDLNDCQCSIWTNNGRVLEYPPTAAKINIEGYESVTRYTKSGLLIDGSDDGYTWTNTSINTYNTLFTFSIDEILEVDEITLKGAVVPDNLIIMIHNLHDKPTKEEIENENHNVKYIYSDTNMFDSETEHFTYTRIIQAPPEPVVEPVERLVANGGSWYNRFDYLYVETTPEGRYLYGLVEKGSTARLNNDIFWDVEYDPSDNRFYDVGASNPYTWGIDDVGTNLSAFPTAGNMKTQYWYHENGDLILQIDNPYYVAPVEPVVEPVARLVATAGNWYNRFDYSYFETTSDGRCLYGLVHEGTDNRNDGSDKWDVEYDPKKKKNDVGPDNPYTWGQDNTSTNLLEFPTLSNMETHYWYKFDDDSRFQFENPYYVA